MQLKAVNMELLHSCDALEAQPRLKQLALVVSQLCQSEIGISSSARAEQSSEISFTSASIPDSLQHSRSSACLSAITTSVQCIPRSQSQQLHPPAPGCMQQSVISTADF